MQRTATPDNNNNNKADPINVLGEGWCFGTESDQEQETTSQTHGIQHKIRDLSLLTTPYRTVATRQPTSTRCRQLGLILLANLGWLARLLVRAINKVLLSSSRLTQSAD